LASSLRNCVLVAAHACFGSNCDMAARSAYVRFAPHFGSRAAIPATPRSGLSFPILR
jgi:hypothetical protein